MKYKIIPKKCEFAEKCPLYSKDLETCSKYGGFYGSKYAGCYIYMQKKMEKERNE